MEGVSIYTFFEIGLNIFISQIDTYMFLNYKSRIPVKTKFYLNILQLF